MIFIDTHNYLKRIYHGGGSPYGLFYEMLAKHQDALVEVVCDGPNSRTYRKDMHPGYKAGRNQGDDPIYWELYNNCIGLALEFKNTRVVQMTAGEADDYIALKAIANDKVISNDKDMWPLIDKGVKILLNASTAVDLELVRMKFNAEPRHIQLYKALVGDTSDKIPGKRGFGAATWAKMDYEDRELYSHHFSLYFGDNHMKGVIYDEDLMTESALMSWQLALPWDKCTADIIMGKPNGNPMAFIEAKGIML